MTMMANKHQITATDILPLPEYMKVRAQTRTKMAAIKRDRRVDVGPHVTFYFENFDTMWMQVQEMLYIEKGGDEQVADELKAYNPLIPQGSELVRDVHDRDRRSGPAQAHPRPPRRHRGDGVHHRERREGRGRR